MNFRDLEAHFEDGPVQTTWNRWIEARLQLDCSPNDSRLSAEIRAWIQYTLRCTQEGVQPFGYGSL